MTTSSGHRIERGSSRVAYSLKTITARSHRFLAITLFLFFCTTLLAAGDNKKPSLAEQIKQHKANLIKPHPDKITVYVEGRLTPWDEYPGFEKAQRAMELNVFKPMKKFTEERKWIWKEFRLPYESKKRKQQRKTYGYKLYMLAKRPPLKILFEKDTGILFCFIDVPKDSKKLFLCTIDALDELKKHIKDIKVTEPTTYWKTRDKQLLDKYFVPPKRPEKEPTAKKRLRDPYNKWIFIGGIVIIAFSLLLWVYSLWRRTHPVSAEKMLGPIPELPPKPEKEASSEKKSADEKTETIKFQEEKPEPRKIHDKSPEEPSQS